VTKRLFDVLFAAAGLALLSPLLAAIAIWIRLDSRGPVLFRQTRMGRAFTPFVIYKFRTMTTEAAGGPLITTGGDSRITRAGRYLRAAKLDELPQLFNVLKGDMSLVGPRPEVPRYVELFHDDYRDVLRVRPGVTDLASLKYRDEAALLGEAVDPEQAYVNCVLPDKIRLAKLYVARSSICFDLALIFRTVGAIVLRRRSATATP
jgi:lipopolysaccharide/colanic/teichoic acid biosynthesis glycosyltransferase